MERVYDAGGGVGCANLTFNVLSEAQRQMFIRTITTPTPLQQRDLEQEKRQINLKNRQVQIEIKVSREDFPLIQAKIKVSYFESTPQEAWSKLEADICKSLGIEFLHSILERGDKAPIFRIIGLKNGGDYLVRQRENSAVLEVLNTGKPPMEISWEVTKNIVGVQKDLAFGARQHPLTCTRIASLVNRPMTKAQEYDIKQKIISANSAAEVISLLTSLYLPGVDQSDPQFGITGLLIKLNDIEPFKDHIDIISLHRLGMEQFDRLVYRGQAVMVIKEGLSFILRLLKELIHEVDIAAVAIKVLSDTVAQHVDHKEQVLHAILNVMQTHCPISPAHRPRKPKRLGNISTTETNSNSTGQDSNGQVQYKFQDNNYFDPKKGVKQAVPIPVDINRFTRYSQVTSLDKDHSRHRKVTNVIESITKVIEFDSKGLVITPRTKQRMIQEQQVKAEAIRLKKEKDKRDAEQRRQLAQERLLEKDRSLMLQLISEEDEHNHDHSSHPLPSFPQQQQLQQPLVLINNRERLPPSMATRPAAIVIAIDQDQQQAATAVAEVEEATAAITGRTRRLSFHDASTSLDDEKGITEVTVIAETAAAGAIIAIAIDDDEEFDRQEEAIISAAKNKNKLKRSKSRSPSAARSRSPSAARRRSSAGSIRSAGALQRGSLISRLGGGGGNDSSTSRAGSASYDGNIDYSRDILDDSNHNQDGFHLPALVVDNRDDRRDSLSSYHQQVSAASAANLNRSRPPSLPSSPLHHRKRLLQAVNTNLSSNPTTAAAAAAAAAASEVPVEEVEKQNDAKKAKQANKSKFIIKRNHSQYQPNETDPSSAASASLTWSGTKGSIGKRCVPEELKLTRAASAVTVNATDTVVVTAAAAVIGTEPPSSEVSSLPSTRPASAAVIEAAAIPSPLALSKSNDAQEASNTNTNTNVIVDGQKQAVERRGDDMGVRSWIPTMPELTSIHLPSSMTMTTAVQAQTDIPNTAAVVTTKAKSSSSGGGSNPYTAAIKMAKKTFAKLKLQPLPIVPCHTIRAFDLQDPAFVVLIQGFAAVLQMLLLTYGHREWAFNNGLVAELADMVLCVPGIPRVLEYFVNIVETLYREGFGDPFEFINNVTYTQDDDPTLVISTVNNDSSSVVSHNHEPPMAVIDTISELSLPTIDKDYIWSRPVNDISGNNDEKAAALENQLAEIRIIKANKSTEPKEVVLVGQQVNALPHKDSPRSIKAVAPPTAATAAALDGQAMASHVVEGANMQPVIAASSAPIMLSSAGRQASMTTVQTTHTINSNNTANKRRPSNTAVEGAVGIPLQHVSDAQRNPEVLKAVGLSEFESRYVTCPSVHVITALSMCVYHVEVGHNERDLARYWLEFWFDGTREYMVNVRKGKDLSGM